jgi:hypothetical protein
MAFFATIVNALVPIVFVALLGLIAGWTRTSRAAPFYCALTLTGI